MTVQEAIDFVDEVKPNSFTDENKTKWLSDCEGKVQTQVFLLAPVDVKIYTWPEAKDYELLVAPPYDKLYLSYLEAQIDYHNGEYGKYQNTMTMFNFDFSEFMRWFANTYRPADAWRWGP